jgi:mevalonate kinase
MQTKTLYANGKLLITGEYVILDGAVSLAFPCKFGQSLECLFTLNNEITWQSYDRQHELWFSAKLDSQLNILETSDTDKAAFLKKLLSYCCSVTSPANRNQFLAGASIQTHLTFPTNWGLGSSSTLLVTLAQLFEIDAYALHFAMTNGSGYDIACGETMQALLYELKPHSKEPHVTLLPTKPLIELSDSIYFIHLNQKQKSDREVASYSTLKKDIDLVPLCETISDLTNQLLTVKDLSYFNELIETHEVILSTVLQRNTIKEDLFQLYKGGSIKSLGAWGGDFIMVTGKSSDLDYFRDKGYTTILSFDEMIL